MAKARFISNRIRAKIAELRVRARLELVYLSDIIGILTNLVDSGVVSESILFTIDKILDDALDATDSIAVNIDKPVSDNIDTTDVIDIINASLFKAINDSVLSSDALDILLNKNLSDSSAVTDLILNLLTKVLQDNISTTDSGLIVNQDYVDISYFDEDYIGDSETF